MNTKNIVGRVVYYEDGDLIFKENSVSMEVYIIESGKVELSKIICGKRTIIAILRKGDFFGETGLFKDMLQNVTATASGKTTLLALSVEEMLYRMQTNLQFAINTLQSLMDRLRNTTSGLTNLITRINEFSNGIVADLVAEKRPLKIGEILIEMDYLTKYQLERALQKQNEAHLLNLEHKLLGEIMVEFGMITDEQLRKTLSEQQIRFHHNE
jgi:CRP/FNR family cyclic AMP-dependent transcriptional regulator